MSNQPLHALGHIILATEAPSQEQERFPGYIMGVGGRVNAGEDAAAAVLRKIKQEATINVRPEDVKLKAVGIHHHLDRDEIWVIFVYLAHTDTTPPVESKEGTFRWMTVDELKQQDKLLFPPSSHYFDHVLGDRPGILSDYSEWRNHELVRVLSRTTSR